MKMIIKSLVAVGVLAVSSGVFAASQVKCSGGGGEASITPVSTGFVVNGFALKCSANVYLAYDEDTTKVAVCAASKKGSRYFGGTSEGGAVKEKADTVVPANLSTVAAQLASGC